MRTIAPPWGHDSWERVPPPRLLRPEVAYADGGAGSRAPLEWRAEAEGGFLVTDGVFEMRAELRPVGAPLSDGARLLTLRAGLRRAAAIRSASVGMLLHAPAPPRHLDRRLRWRTLRGDAVLDEMTPCVVWWREPGGRTVELRTIPSAVPVRLSWSGGMLRVTCVLDAPALHPRWSFREGYPVSTATPVPDASWGAEIGLLWRFVDEAEGAPAVPARFPAGAEAAFVITDHADFDTVPALGRFVDGDGRAPGWLGRGLRLTKSVFAVRSDSVPRPPASTLECAEYRTLIARLHAEGSEIAPHGVNESGTVDPARFRAALASVAGEFQPRTWIDHGLSLRYCYTMGGADDPEYELLARLREHGIGTLWSYHDAPGNAAAGLNMILPGAHDLPAVLGRCASHAGHGRVLTLAHYLRSALVARVGGASGAVIARSLSTARRTYLRHAASAHHPAVATMLAAGVALTALMERDRPWRNPDSRPVDDPPTRRALREWAPTVYPERAVPLFQMRDGDLLLFASQEVVHTRDAYRPAAIDRLVAERGLHIGHTYLLNRLPYIAGLFVPEANGDRGPRVSGEWVRTLDALEEMVRTGRLWNPPLGGLTDWVRAAARVRVRPGAAGTLLLTNHGPAAVRGYTVLLPAGVRAADVSWNGRPPSGSRAWAMWRCVWGDIPAGGEVMVRWRSPGEGAA